VVALLGRPNAGKSTLLNRLLGQKLAIVTARPQTTRSRILGILTRPGAQLLLLDTPGFHEAGRPLNQALNAAVEDAADDCDVAVLLVDPAAGWDAGHDALLARLGGRGVPVLVVGTRCDLSAAAAAPWPPAGAAAAAACLRISARTGKGVEALLDAVLARLPEGPAFYGEDELTDRPLRFLAAELVREAAFEALSQEVPYALAVEVESFDESRADLVRIRANLLVERASQKPIVVGRGGTMIRSIGIEARQRIEALLGTRVHLDLWVKVEPRWSRKPRRLQALGYG
jgi:GTP-binding protein Era